MADVVRAALVGAGGYSGKHLAPHIPDFTNLRYVVVCDVNSRAARRVAKRIGAEAVARDLAEVLARDDVDMVDLQTPNFLHAEQAVAAFAAGKHVLSQKPMATTVEDAKRMIRAGREADRRLGVYIDDLNDPLLWDMKAALDGGFVGRPVGFRMRYAHQGGLRLAEEAWRRQAANVGGGCFILLTVHYVNAIAWLLGTRVRRVTGLMKTLMAPMEGDDTAEGVLELETGLVGAAGASYLSVGCPTLPKTFLEVSGVEGVIRYQQDERMLVLYSRSQTFRGACGSYEKPGRTVRLRRARRTLRRPTLHEQFAASILGGSPQLTPGEAGLHDLAVCQALEASSREGRAVDVSAFIGGPA